MTEIKGILFDKDGTLVDFNSIWVPVAKKLIDEFCLELGLNRFCDIKQRLYEAVGMNDDTVKPDGVIVWGTADDIAVSIIEVLNYDEIDGHIPKDFGGYIRDKINRLVNDNKNLIEPKGNVKKLLNELKCKGIHIGLATADTYESAEVCLNKLNITGYFDYIGADDGSTCSKPNPEHIIKFCSKCGIEPGQVAVVGDSSTDIDFAENGNAAFAIAVLSGAKDIDSHVNKARYKLNSVEELLDLSGNLIWEC